MFKRLRERYALSASERRVELMDILDVFWSNVFWHIENKGLNEQKVIGKTYCVLAKNRTYNPSLKRAQQIAKKLDIDDYAILFERVE